MRMTTYPPHPPGTPQLCCGNLTYITNWWEVPTAKLWATGLGLDILLESRIRRSYPCLCHTCAVFKLSRAVTNPFVTATFGAVRKGFLTARKKRQMLTSAGHKKSEWPSQTCLGRMTLAPNHPQMNLGAPPAEKERPDISIWPCVLNHGYGANY